MRLVDLGPQWVLRDGQRIGFIFKCPTRPDQWQSCYENTPSRDEQMDLHEALVGEKSIVQCCNPSEHWSIAGGIAAASFDTMTVTPSLDGSKGGNWHGHITNGEIVGGLA